MVPSQLFAAILAVFALNAAAVPTPLSSRDNFNLRCGSSWEDANSKCGDVCPGGVDRECKNGETCFKDIDTAVCKDTSTDTPAPAPQPQPEEPSPADSETIEFPPTPKWITETVAPTPAPAPQPEPVPTPAPEKETHPLSGSGSTRCGTSWANANGKCGTACPGGVDSQCSNGEKCYKDLDASVCDSGNGPAPAPQPQPGDEDPAPAPAPQPQPTDEGSPAPAPEPQPEYPQQGGGESSIGSMISESAFNKALTTCGINKPKLYGALLKGFTAPIASLQELALLMGNTAHESGSYDFTEEIKCKGVTEVTNECPYGFFHGRGYIQLTWDSNYKAAAAALNRPDIFSNPTIVQDDEATNWATVQWYWTSTVQPMLKSSGYTLGASVKSINGYLECGSNPVAPQRVKFIQCFEQQFTGTQSSATYC
ncbi:Chitinase 1 [Chytriomyces hyalinus]|nr:Chitinase 1 [Chytriomyces hyalinus]